MTTLIFSKATRSGTGLYNMLDLMQIIVSTHYVCNLYIIMWNLMG